MANSGFSLSGAFLRSGLAVLLVLATFNPSGYSFVHWLMAPPTAFTPAKAIAALVLIIGWLMCLRTAFIALGKFGLLLRIWPWIRWSESKM